MCEDFEEKVNSPPLLSSPSLFTSPVTQTREEEEDNAPLYCSNAKNKIAQYSHAQKPPPLWCWR